MKSSSLQVLVVRMRWICLDPGSKRTGVAVSSPENTFAIPVEVIEHGEFGPPLDELERLMREYLVEGIVLGLPVYMNGSASPQTAAALRLAQRIVAHFNTVLEAPFQADTSNNPAEISLPSATGHAGIRVLLWDERLSSWEAERLTAGNDATTRKKARRRRVVDAHAAAVILQSFLDSQQAA